MTKQLGLPVATLVLFYFKVLANCLQVLLACFVMTCECHFHLAVSEEGCAFCHLYIFGLNTIIGYMVGNLCYIMSPCYVGLCYTQILKSYFGYITFFLDCFTSWYITALELDCIALCR